MGSTKGSKAISHLKDLLPCEVTYRFWLGRGPLCGCFSSWHRIALGSGDAMTNPALMEPLVQQERPLKLQQLHKGTKHRAPAPGRESMVALRYRRACFPAPCCVLHSCPVGQQSATGLPVLPKVGGASVCPQLQPQGPCSPGTWSWAWLGLLCTGRTV